MKKLNQFSILLITLLAFTSCELYDLVVPEKEDNTYKLELKTAYITDIDGNSYLTVKLGTQWWMAENLRTTRYANGKKITYTPSTSDWLKLDSENSAYCFYQNNDSLRKYTTGGLYTWAAATNNSRYGSESLPSNLKGVCPDGWHLPSNAEWELLDSVLTVDAGTSAIGKHLKDKYSWDSNKGDNRYYFNALASGFRTRAGQYDEFGASCGWWSATETGSDIAYIRYFRSNGQELQSLYNYKTTGYSVRCVQD